MKRGAVVTASIGGDSAKPRPFLVLRSDRFADHTMVTILAFSATIIDAPLLRVTVRPTPENGLERTSQAMIDHVQSVRLTRIQKEIGQLPVRIFRRSSGRPRFISDSPIRLVPDAFVLGRSVGGRAALD